MCRFATVRPLVHALPPEMAHRLGLFLLERRLYPPARAFESALLHGSVMGLVFANPVGLAAGFDKNAQALAGLKAQGFGFIEAGTATPLPQAGNPRPRLFRLPEDEAVINRMGFNNDGLETFVRNLSRRPPGVVIGANIGKNKHSTDAVADYVRGLSAVYAQCDYVTVNVSSPNTPGLRDLQKKNMLAELLSALRVEREVCQQRHGFNRPLLVKLAPDLSGQELEDAVEQAIAHGVDGLIISNTTLGRPASLRSLHAAQAGGLSGRPLFAPSTDMLRRAYRLSKGRLALVGAGGVAGADDAYAKICAGAALVQLYSALVYQGFSLVRDIQKGLCERLKADGFEHVSQAVGVDAQ